MSDEALINCLSCYHFKDNWCRRFSYYFKNHVAKKTMCKDWFEKEIEQ